mmetsp:Transcript_127987/g.410069  ORF Transcript_127987/g.410069 Transcript_127987/m.410069 type:complete len:296 (-) Transcript_127987:1358-2245(-)
MRKIERLSKPHKTCTATPQRAVTLLCAWSGAILLKAGPSHAPCAIRQLRMANSPGTGFEFWCRCRTPRLGRLLSNLWGSDLVVVEVAGREPLDGCRAGFGSILQRLPPQGLSALEVSETMLDVGQRHGAINAEQRLKPAGRSEAGVRDRAHAESLLQISCLRFDPSDHRAAARAHDRVQEACVDQDFLCPIAFVERLIHLTSRDVQVGHRREHVGAARRPDLPELRQDLLGPPDIELCKVILANLRVHQGSDHDRTRCILRLSQADLVEDATCLLQLHQALFGVPRGGEHHAPHP